MAMKRKNFSEKRGRNSAAGGAKPSYRMTIEEFTTAIAKLKRPVLIARIKNFKGPIKLDFTDAHLNNYSDDGLRHILFRAMTLSMKTKPKSSN